MDAELGSDINFDKLETMRDFDILFENIDALTIPQRFKFFEAFYKFLEKMNGE